MEAAGCVVVQPTSHLLMSEQKCSCMGSQYNRIHYVRLEQKNLVCYNRTPGWQVYVWLSSSRTSRHHITNVYKHFRQGTVAYLPLCYTDHEHSFVHRKCDRNCDNLSSVRFGVVSNTVCNVRPGTTELITAFITS